MSNWWDTTEEEEIPTIPTSLLTVDVDPTLGFEGNANRFGQAVDEFQNLYAEQKKEYDALKFQPSISELAANALLSLAPIAIGYGLGGNKGGAIGAAAGLQAGQSYGQSLKSDFLEKKKEKASTIKDTLSSLLEAKKLQSSFAQKDLQEDAYKQRPVNQITSLIAAQQQAPSEYQDQIKAAIDKKLYGKAEKAMEDDVLEALQRVKEGTSSEADLDLIFSERGQSQGALDELNRIEAQKSRATDLSIRSTDASRRLKEFNKKLEGGLSTDNLSQRTKDSISSATDVTLTSNRLLGKINGLLEKYPESAQISLGKLLTERYLPTSEADSLRRELNFVSQSLAAAQQRGQLNQKELETFQAYLSGAVPIATRDIIERIEFLKQRALADMGTRLRTEASQPGTKIAAMSVVNGLSDVFKDKDRTFLDSYLPVDRPSEQSSFDPSSGDSRVLERAASGEDVTIRPGQPVPGYPGFVYTGKINPTTGKPIARRSN